MYQSLSNTNLLSDPTVEGYVDLSNAIFTSFPCDEATITLDTDTESQYFGKLKVKQTGITTTQIADLAVTDAKILSMSSRKLTDEVRSVADPDAPLEWAVQTTGRVLPSSDGLYDIGDVVRRYATIYSDDADVSTRLNVPTIDHSLGVKIQYAGADRIATTMDGITVSGNSSMLGSALISGNAYPALDTTHTLGLSASRWLTAYVKNIQSSDGVDLAYGTSTKLSTTTTGVTVAGALDCGNRTITCGTIVPSGTSGLTIGNTTNGNRVTLLYGNTQGEDFVRIGNNTQNQKMLVLFNNADNTHQFTGFGVNNNEFQYRSGNNLVPHRWYQGATSTSSTLLFTMASTACTSTVSLTVGTNALTSGSLVCPVVNSAASVAIQSGGVARLTASATGCLVTSLSSSGTISCGANAFTCGAAAVTSLSSSGTVSCGASSLTCGSVISPIVESALTVVVRTGTTPTTRLTVADALVTSAVPLTCGANAFTCGAASVVSMSASGTISCGANALTCGTVVSPIVQSAVSVAVQTGTTPATRLTVADALITAAVPVTCGANAFTCGALTASSVSFTGAMTSGAISCTSITSGGGTASFGGITGSSLALGSGTIGAGAISCTSLTSNGGTISAGTSSVTCGTVVVPTIQSSTGVAIQTGTTPATRLTIADALITAAVPVTCGTNAFTCGAASVTSMSCSGTASISSTLTCSTIQPTAGARLNLTYGSTSAAYVDVTGVASSLKWKKLCTFDGNTASDSQFTGLGVQSGQAVYHTNRQGSVHAFYTGDSGGAPYTTRYLCASIGYDTGSQFYRDVNLNGNAFSCGASSVTSMSSSGTISCGANTITCGAIDNAAGWTLQYGGNPKALVTSTGITVNGTLVATTINPPIGSLILQRAGVDRLATTSTGCTIYNDLACVGNISYVTSTSTGGTIRNVTNVSTTPFTVLSTHHTLAVQATVQRTLNLPSAPAIGTEYVITDYLGSCHRFPITIARGGTDLINGNTAIVMNGRFSTLKLCYVAALSWAII